MRVKIIVTSFPRPFPVWILNFKMAARFADSYASTFDESHAQKEIRQRQHYFLLEKMQCMAKDLPPRYQQRMPNELLSDITNALLDGTVYEIVKGLKEIQAMTEKTLFTHRMKTVNSQKFELLETQKKHKEMMNEMMASSRSDPIASCLQLQTNLQHQLEGIKKRHAEATTRMDMKIILELDQKVSDQQVTLEKAGVPGFFVTNNPVEIRLQMYLLEFIQRLSAFPLPN